FSRAQFLLRQIFEKLGTFGNVKANNSCSPAGSLRRLVWRFRDIVGDKPGRPIRYRYHWYPIGHAAGRTSRTPAPAPRSEPPLPAGWRDCNGRPEPAAAPTPRPELPLPAGWRSCIGRSELVASATPRPELALPT